MSVNNRLLTSAFTRALINSLGIAILATAVSVIIAMFAAYAIAPVFQITVYLFLCIVPSRNRPQGEVTGRDAAASDSGWVPVTQGVLVGVALTVFAVAVGALVFGTGVRPGA